MRPIEKRIVDNPDINIANRELAINQAKKWRKTAKTAKEKREIDNTIKRLEGEIRSIKEKKNLAAEKQAILQRLDKAWREFQNLTFEAENYYK